MPWQGITKNKRLYLPFLLTCVGMVMMTYILLSLASSPILKTFPGGDTMPMILGMGSFVMAAFAVLFLFYTNSFLIRRRNREFGLYNILGMGKGNLAKVLAWETVIMALISIAGGEVLGIALGKLFELLLVNIVDGTVQMQFTVSVPATTMTTILYLAIFALLFLRSLVTVCKTNAAALCAAKPTAKSRRRRTGCSASPALDPRRGILHRRDDQAAADGAGGVLHRRSDGHRGDVSDLYLRLRGAVPHAAEEQALLLSEKPLHLRFLHGLPHEAQWRGTGLDLYSCHDGARYAFIDDVPLFRQGGCAAHTLSERSFC